MIATDGPRNPWTYRMSPAYTLQGTLQAEHWPETNLTPNSSCNAVMADTHTHSNGRMQLAILQEKLECRINGSTQRINAFFVTPLLKIQFLGFISQNGGLNILHNSSRQFMHKYVPLRIEALKGNPRLDIMPIAQLYAQPPRVLPCLSRNSL